MSEPDPKTVREIARTAFGYLPHDYVHPRFVQAAMAEHGIDDHDVPTWSAYSDAVKADLAGAVATWPDEQPQDERDVEIAKLRADLAEMIRCRDNALAYAERQHVPIELDGEIDTDGEELANRIDGELLGPGWDWEDDRTAGLLAKQAVAVVRPHLARLTDQAQKAREALAKAQYERDGDVRAYPGKPGDGWQDQEGARWVHCADGQMRMVVETEEAEEPARLDMGFEPMVALGSSSPEATR